MSHIDGSIGTIDLVNPKASDYYKIGVAHGEQGWAKDSTYTGQPSYLEGYANGAYKRSYLFPAEASVPRTLTYVAMTGRYATYRDAYSLTYDQLTNYSI